MAPWLRALACLLALWSSARAQADTPAPGLNWVRMSGAESCVSAADLALAVETRVGHELFVAPSQADLFMDGRIERRRGGYRVSLQVSDRGGRVLGQRALNFRGADCALVTAPVALIIAITLAPRPGETSPLRLDPQLSAELSALFDDDAAWPEPSPMAGAPPEASTPAANAERRPGPNAQPPATRTRRSGPSLGALAGMGGGMVPTPGYFWGVSASWRFEEGTRLEASAVSFLDSTLRVRDLGWLTIDLLESHLAVCPWAVVPDELQVCVGAAVGILRAVPTGFAGTETRRSHALVRAEATLAYRPVLISQLHARAALVIGAPLMGRAFTVEDQDGGAIVAFRTSVLTARLEVGLSWSF